MNYIIFFDVDINLFFNHLRYPIIRKINYLNLQVFELVKNFHIQRNF